MNKKQLNQSIQPIIPFGTIPMSLVLFNVALTLFYFSWWFQLDHIGNPILYGLLFFGEVYHVVMLLLFWLTVARLKHSDPPVLPTLKKNYSVDIFITVAGEPLEIVKQTVQAAQKINYPNKNIFILNDSFVAGKENWQAYESLAQELEVNCITRRKPGGAKAGNINNALKKTSGDIVVIFDADMAAHPQFLQKTVPYFIDDRVGFVQTPQYYLNASENQVTAAAWEQQEFFFGPIMRGKNTHNAAFICGTNVALRRTALESVGGINEKSIAEDFLTSLYIHQRGWSSIYVPEVLAQGLAPEDLLSYYKQQSRWARGSVQILFHHNPLFMSGLSWKQKAEYLASALFYFNGVIVAIDMLIPVFILLTGISPVNADTTIFALYFTPFMLAIIYNLQIISAGQLTLRAISFTHSSWYLQIKAVWAALTGQKASFSVTSKQALSGNFIFLALPHLFYAAISVVAMGVALWREGVTPSVISNIAWVTFSLIFFLPFIATAINWSTITSSSWLGAKKKLGLVYEKAS